MTLFDLTCRLRMLGNMFQAGELDLWEHRLLRRGAALAYAEGKAQRRQARRQVQSAVETGRMQRPGICENCGTDGPVEGHHPDYSRPLEVSWLCERCHDRADRELAGNVPVEVR